MLELMTLDLVDKGLVTKQFTLTIGYDVENTAKYKGEIKTDRYGRKIPKHAHGTANLEKYTSSTRLISDAVLKLYDEIVDRSMTVRRITIAACNLISEKNAEINAQIKDSGYVLKVFIRGYYEISGFIRGVDERYVYFSIGDVIYDKKWYNNVLVRETKNANDYTGGQNMFVKLDELGTACKLILSRKIGLAA